MKSNLCISQVLHVLYWQQNTCTFLFVYSVASRLFKKDFVGHKAEEYRTSVPVNNVCITSDGVRCIRTAGFKYQSRSGNR